MDNLYFERLIKSVCEGIVDACLKALPEALDTGRAYIVIDYDKNGTIKITVPNNKTVEDEQNAKDIREVPQSIEPGCNGSNSKNL